MKIYQTRDEIKKNHRIATYSLKIAQKCAKTDSENR